MKKNKTIGIDVKAPKEKCDDRYCPFHGQLKIRTNTLVGTVISSKMQKSATIEMPRSSYIQKYERYEKKRTKIKAHNPTCINAKEGDIVKIVECKPLSKTKNFVIIEKIEHKIIAEKEEKYATKPQKKEEEKEE